MLSNLLLNILYVRSQWWLIAFVSLTLVACSDSAEVSDNNATPKDNNQIQPGDNNATEPSTNSGEPSPNSGLNNHANNSDEPQPPNEANNNSDEPTDEPIDEIDTTPWRSELFPDNWSPSLSRDDGWFLHDFSYAGYHNGEAELPIGQHGEIFDIVDFGADPTGVSDSTTVIQNAIDAAQLAGGGIIYIPTGQYRVDDRITINSSQIVLRGDGSEHSKISFSSHQGMSNKAHISFVGALTRQEEYALHSDGENRASYVDVESIGDLNVGDDIAIGWVITPAFIDEHNMTDIWGPFNDRWQPFFRRTILAIEDVSEAYRIHLDVPLRYPAKVRDSASIRVETGFISECGVEGIGVSNAIGWDDAWNQRQVHALSMYGVKDCWIDDIASFESPYAPTEGPGSGAHLQSGGIIINHSKRVTVANSTMEFPQNRGVNGNGYLFEVRQSNEILYRDLVARAGRHNFIQNWGFGATGIVWLRTQSLDGRAYPDKNSNLFTTGKSEFHHSLAMANLIDSSYTNDGWAAINRRHYSSGAGHAGTQNVFWNIQGPGGVHSFQFGHGYVIGTGDETTANTRIPDLPPEQIELLEEVSVWGGIQLEDWTEGVGRAQYLEPQSLYEAQLARRLSQ